MAPSDEGPTGTTAVDPESSSVGDGTGATDSPALTEGTTTDPTTTTTTDSGQATTTDSNLTPTSDSGQAPTTDPITTTTTDSGQPNSTDPITTAATDSNQPASVDPAVAPLYDSTLSTASDSKQTLPADSSPASNLSAPNSNGAETDSASPVVAAQSNLDQAPAPAPAIGLDVPVQFAAPVATLSFVESSANNEQVPVLVVDESGEIVAVIAPTRAELPALASELGISVEALSGGIAVITNGSTVGIHKGKLVVDGKNVAAGNGKIRASHPVDTSAGPQPTPVNAAGVSVSVPAQAPLSAPAPTQTPVAGSSSGTASGAPGSSGGSGAGFAATGLLALLGAAGALRLSRRLSLTTAVWRPVAFNSPLERPG